MKKFIPFIVVVLAIMALFVMLPARAELNIPANAGTRMAALEAYTNRVQALEGLTNTYNQAAVDAAAATGDVATAIADLDTVEGGSIQTRKTVLGPDNTDILVVESGTCTNGETVAFTTAFGATPQVFVTYQEDAGADTVCEAASVTTTNFACQAAVAKSCAWLAIGQK